MDTDYDDEEYCTVCQVMTGGTNCEICNASICFDHSRLDTNGLAFCLGCYEDLCAAMNEDE